MAQRTGAERFLAPRAKLTSAGGTLALVSALALAVCGCGGGSPEAQTASATGSSEASAESTSSTSSSSAAAADAKHAAKAASSAPSAASGDGEAPGGAPGAKPGTGSGKHGPRIATPKGAPEQAPSSSERAQAAVASMSLSSPAIGEPPLIPAPYTCDGKDSWPALQWQGIPSGTEELALFAMNSQPVEEKLFFDWAVASLDPSLQGIEAARLPKGAVMGKNSDGKIGYSICPSGEETYVFAVYALPRKLSAAKGFDPHALREEVLRSSGDVGLLAASYTRG